MRAANSRLIGLVFVVLLFVTPVMAQEYGIVRVHQPAATSIQAIVTQNSGVLYMAIVRDSGAVVLHRDLGDPAWNYSITADLNETAYAAWGGDMGPAEEQGKRICCWWESFHEGHLSYQLANCYGDTVYCQDQKFECNKIWDSCPEGTTDHGPAFDANLS